MNKVLIKINGVDYSKKVVAPFKFGDLLDERLDEAYITLKNLKEKEPFRPLSLVEIDLVCEGEQKLGGIKETERVDVEQTYNEDHTLTQKISKRFIVANDTVNNYPVGTELYTHDLYFIEETKILEGFICDSISFTNALGHNYVGDSEQITLNVQTIDRETDKYVYRIFNTSKELSVGTIVVYGPNKLNKAKVESYEPLDYIDETFVGKFVLSYPKNSDFASLRRGEIIQATINYWQF